MNKGFFNVPTPTNEPIKEYREGSPEKQAFKKVLAEMKSQTMDIPMVIGGEEVYTDNKVRISPPYDHQHILGYFNQGDKTAKAQWNALSWEQRASIFLRAADLLAGPYRAKINAATMLAQSKNIFQIRKKISNLNIFCKSLLESLSNLKNYYKSS